LKPFFTGSKLLFSAVFVIGVLVTTAFANQKSVADPDLAQPAVASAIGPGAYGAKNSLPAQHPSLAIALSPPAGVQVVLPITDPPGAPTAAQATPQAVNPTAAPSLPSLDAFVAQVTDGQSGGLVGIYVSNVMALHIVQQPNGDPAYIDRTGGTATQFARAGLFGVIGLLAHNFLSGREFFQINSGQDLVLVYGNGRTAHYTVTEIGDFQRLSRSDLRSDFINLETQQKESANQVFAHYYQQKQVLTLQTCIARNGISDWGVRFIMARPTS